MVIILMVIMVTMIVTTMATVVIMIIILTVIMVMKVPVKIQPFSFMTSEYQRYMKQNIGVIDVETLINVFTWRSSMQIRNDKTKNKKYNIQNTQYTIQNTDIQERC